MIIIGMHAIEKMWQIKKKVQTFTCKVTFITLRLF